MSLIKFFDDIRGVNVIIVGDVMLDSYIIGKIERKSPEAPVPIVNVSNKENRIGGAANVALNIKALGGIPHLCSCIGDDDAGNNFMSLMQKNGLSSEGIISSNKRKTTVKERIIVNKKHVLRIDDEMTSTISFNVQKKLIQIIKKLIGAMVFVVVEEVIPETQLDKYTDIASMGFIIGFVIMMSLDVALGWGNPISSIIKAIF